MFRTLMCFVSTIAVCSLLCFSGRALCALLGAGLIRVCFDVSNMFQMCFGSVSDLFRCL